MKKQAVLIASLASVVVLSGCSHGKLCCSEENPQSVVVHQKLMATEAPVSTVGQKPELMKISGIGYGAESTFGAYTAGQRRLMAIRASKLDAYRALAEQLYGHRFN
jgi:hypothetical protein